MNEKTITVTGKVVFQFGLIAMFAGFLLGFGIATAVELFW